MSTICDFGIELLENVWHLWDIFNAQNILSELSLSLSRILHDSRFIQAYRRRDHIHKSVVKENGPVTFPRSAFPSRQGRR